MEAIEGKLALEEEEEEGAPIKIWVVQVDVGFFWGQMGRMVERQEVETGGMEEAGHRAG